MLEDEKQVAALVKQTLSEMGPKKNAHIDFYPLFPDSVGVMNLPGLHPSGNMLLDG